VRAITAPRPQRPSADEPPCHLAHDRSEGLERRRRGPGAPGEHDVCHVAGQRTKTNAAAAQAARGERRTRDPDAGRHEREQGLLARPRCTTRGANPARANTASKWRYHGGPGAAGCEDPRLVCELGELQLGATGPRPVRGQHGGDRLGEHDLGIDVVHERRAREAGVEVAVADAGHALRDRHVTRLERNARMPRAQCAHDRRHHLLRDPR
jgi:hypothetical protein